MQPLGTLIRSPKAEVSLESFVADDATTPTTIVLPLSETRKPLRPRREMKELWYKLFGVSYASYNEIMQCWKADNERLFYDHVRLELIAKYYFSQYFRHRCLSPPVGPHGPVRQFIEQCRGSECHKTCVKQLQPFTWNITEKLPPKKEITMADVTVESMLAHCPMCEDLTKPCRCIKQTKTGEWRDLAFERLWYEQRESERRWQQTIDNLPDFFNDLLQWYRNHKNVYKISVPMEDVFVAYWTQSDLYCKYAIAFCDYAEVIGFRGFAYSDALRAYAKAKNLTPLSPAPIFYPFSTPRKL
jgi:hypothetical protein